MFWLWLLALWFALAFSFAAGWACCARLTDRRTRAILAHWRGAGVELVDAEDGADASQLTLGLAPDTGTRPAFVTAMPNSGSFDPEPSPFTEHQGSRDIGQPAEPAGMPPAVALAGKGGSVKTWA